MELTAVDLLTIIGTLVTVFTCGLSLGFMLGRYHRKQK